MTRSALDAASLGTRFALGVTRFALVLFLERAGRASLIAPLLIQDVVTFHAVALKANFRLTWLTFKTRVRTLKLK